MELDIDSAKRAYNWFHFAFPDFKNNDICTEEDIKLRNDLEKWLVDEGE